MPQPSTSSSWGLTPAPPNCRGHVQVQGGIYGPALEAALKPHGLTLRHYPQSFEFSTAGGWVATRGAGHFATHLTRIDDFVQSVRVVTPSGHVLETRRLPGAPPPRTAPHFPLSPLFLQHRISI